MTDEHICDQLLKWIPLFYGIEKLESAFAYVEYNKFVFGCSGNINRVTKPVAIYLACNIVQQKVFNTQQKMEVTIKRTRTRK